MKRLLLLTILSLIFLGCTQPSNENLVVKVQDNELHMIGQAEVSVYENGQTIKSKTTDKTGIVSFDLGPGSYSVKAWKEGYLSDEKTVNIDKTETIIDLYLTESQCNENWTCTEWSECEESIQYRTCTDENECGTQESKPSEKKECESECETLIDCLNCSNGESVIAECREGNCHYENSIRCYRECDGCESDEDCSKGEKCIGCECKTYECTKDTECIDNEKCTKDKCQENKCVNTQITSCVHNDDCCPSGCEGLDNDCPVIDCQEDSDCSDNNQCTKDGCQENKCKYTTLEDNEECDEGVCCDGECETPECHNASCCEDKHSEVCRENFSCLNPGKCYADCEWDEINACKNDDGCCPSGCEGLDNDCGGCGNDSDCDDSNDCTADTCVDNQCEYGLEPDNTPCATGVCCEGSCALPICENNNDCEEDVCETCICRDPDTCQSECVCNPITQCINNDNCCPSGCEGLDNDCECIDECEISEPAYCQDGFEYACSECGDPCNEWCPKDCSQGTDNCQCDCPPYTTGTENQVSGGCEDGVDNDCDGEIDESDTDCGESGVFIETLDSDGSNVGRYTSMIKLNGELHVSYEANGKVRHAWHDSEWHIETVDSPAVGGGTSITTLGDEIHIAYRDYTNTALKHAWYDGTWHIETVDEEGNTGIWPSITTLGNEIHISYQTQDPDDYRLEHAWYDGSWHTETIDDDDLAGAYSSITTFNNEIHISYAAGGVNGFDLKHAWYDGSWHTETIDDDGNVGAYSSITTKEDELHVSYYASCPHRDLKHAWYDGTWHTETAEDEGDVGKFTSISTEGDEIHIAHYDWGSQELKYTWYDGTWHTEIIDNTGTEGSYPSIVALNDEIHISYYDYNTKDLKYALIRQ